MNKTTTEVHLLLNMHKQNCTQHLVALANGEGKKKKMQEENQERPAMNQSEEQINRFNGFYLRK